METEYALWDYVKPEHRVEDKTTNPFYLNFTDPSIMEVRLIERVWLVMGLVVQSVHYAAYNPATSRYHVPVVLERWNWMLHDPTRFAIARTVQPYGFASVPTPTLVGGTQVIPQTKFYPTYSEQLSELTRRHQNVINEVKELTLKALVLTETRGNLKAAIAIGSKFIEHMNVHIQAYISDGVSTLALESKKLTVRDKFKWLDNDITILGYPGVRLWEVLYSMLMSNTIVELGKVDYQKLFLEI